MTRISVYTWRILLSEAKQELAACIAHTPTANAETSETQHMDPEYLVDTLVRAYV